MPSILRDPFQSKSFSPASLLSPLPTTRKIVKGYWISVAIFNVLELAADLFNQPWIKAWLSWSRPVTDQMATFIFGINQVSHYLSTTPYAYRDEIMRNIIAFNWLLWLIAATCGTLSAVIGVFHEKKLAAEILAKIHATGRDPGAVLFGNGFVTVICVVVLGTNIAYVQPPSLYKTDFSFLLIGFLFYFLLTSYLLCIALSILLLRTSRLDSGSH